MSEPGEKKISNQKVIRQFIAMVSLFTFLLGVTGGIGIYVNYRSTKALKELSESTLEAAFYFGDLLTNLNSLNQELVYLGRVTSSQADRSESLKNVGVIIGKIDKRVSFATNNAIEGAVYQAYFESWTVGWQKWREKVGPRAESAEPQTAHFLASIDELNLLIDKMENINLYAQIDSKEMLARSTAFAEKASVALLFTLVLGACIGLFSGLVIVRNIQNLFKIIAAAEMKLLHTSKLATLGEMSAGVAHEINNPLTIIEASVNLMPKVMGDPEKVEAKLNAIRKAAGRIGKIVSGLKKFSHSSDRNAYANEILGDIVREALVSTEAKSQRHNTPVKCDIKTEASIFCDVAEIEQVLINLINNGIDAVANNEEKWIRIEVFERGMSVVLRVIDSGEGLPEAVRNKVFDPFYTTKPIGKGTGLGLSISKGILDAHQATMAILVDMPNTCFEVEFKNASAGRIAA